MNIYAISSLLAFIVCTSLGIFVLTKGHGNTLNKKFAYVSILIGLWSLFPFVTYVAATDEKALLYGRATYIAAVFTPSAFFHFVFVMLGIEKRRLEKNIIRIFYLISLLLLIIIFNSNFIKGVIRMAPFSTVVPGNLFPLFMLFFSILCPYAIYQIFYKFRNTTGFRRNQLRYLFSGFVIALAGGTLHLLVPYIKREPIPHDLFLVAWAVIITYAIVKHRLMDINLAITRGAVLGVVYFFVLGIPFGMGFLGRDYLIEQIGSTWWLLPLFTGILLSSVGPSIYMRLRDRAEWAFFKKQKQYQEALVALGKRMTLTRDLNELLIWIMRAITVNVGVNYCKIYLWDEKEKEFLIRKEYGIERRRQIEEKLKKDNPLIKFLVRRVEKGAVIKEEIAENFYKKGEEEKEIVNKCLRNMGAELLIPSFIEGEMIGFLVLGVKRNKQQYTSEDLSMFNILSSQAAIAIENAGFYEKTKESQAMLIQASKLSSIGELAAGFAHQVNNPFNAILVNADYMRHAIKKHKDNSLQDNETGIILDGLNENINAIMNSAVKGGNIVKSIMEFSKPSTGEKELIDMKKIIDETISLTSNRLKGKNIETIIDISDNVLQVEGDEIQLEQVFMNLIINAVDAMEEVEGKGILKISAIEVKEEAKIKVEVSDTGEGINDKNRERIFDFFFTTKRNKGTGLGLALTYQIIKAHEGEIRVESVLGEGTKFIIMLPQAVRTARSKE